METSASSGDKAGLANSESNDDDRLLLALQMEAVRQEQRMAVAAEEESDKNFMEISPGKLVTTRQAKRDAMWRIRMRTSVNTLRNVVPGAKYLKKDADVIARTADHLAQLRAIVGSKYDYEFLMKNLSY